MWPRDRTIDRFPLSYVEAVRDAGGVPAVMSAFSLAPGEEPVTAIETITNIEPEEATLPEDAAGLVLPGGGDIDPADFGQEPHPRTYNISKRRDHFEYALLADALERDIPVLAICRGMQVLNVHLGGTLEQHINDKGGRLEHDRDRPRAEPAHGFSAEYDSLVAAALNSTDTSINSHHHQGLDEIPKELVITGRADDGVVESVESREHSWVVGVQWHPEAMAPVSAEERRLFETLVRAADDYASGASAGAATA
jgi:putative glutamine amidotransferase